MQGAREGVTNAQGIFIARLLPPGFYTIDIIRDGFQTARVTRQIGIDQHYQPRIVMQTVAGATIQVVASSLSAVDPTDVKTASNYSADRIDTLPIGRSPSHVMMLAPSVVQGVNDPQIRGSQGSGNLMLVDGQNLMDNTWNAGTFDFATDAFEETQVIIGAISAEYGNIEGGVINTITKSGGNVFSGSLRFDLASQKWNAYKPLDVRGNRTDNILTTMQFTLGGYFLKDKLWFHYAHSEYSRSNGFTIPINSSNQNREAGGAGAGYRTDSVSNLNTAKLTYLINQDHYLVGTYASNSSSRNNASNWSGEINSLTNEAWSSWFYNLAWRAIWSPNFNTEVRYGEKSHGFFYNPTRLHNPNNKWDVMNTPVEDSNNGYMYHVSYWGDDPEYRTNKTANIKGSWFTSWYGSHEIDFGVDYYRGDRESSNAQSINDWQLYVWDWEPGGMGDPVGSGIPEALVWWKTQKAKAGQTQWGFYVNDKWRVNDNLTALIGVRYDTYLASASDVKGTIASAWGVSPRLGLTYDVWGDQKLVAKASFCRYNGPVLEVITGSVSSSGNPEQWAWYSEAGWSYLDNTRYPYTQMVNEITKLMTTRKSDLFPYLGYTDQPLLNKAVNPKMKAPTVDELQLGLSYSFNMDKWGKGFISLTGVRKDWRNMIDYSVGQRGRVSNELGEIFWMQYWDNNPDAKRDYTALEFVGEYVWKNLHISGNVTWSKLKGNYEGEVRNVPGAGQGINYYRIISEYTNTPQNSNSSDTIYTPARNNGQPLWDLKDGAPYGYLAGHLPLMIKGSADYTYENKFGRTVFGFMYSLSHGYQYTYNRWINKRQITPYAHLIPSDFGIYMRQFMDGERTHGKYNTLVYHDIAITHDFHAYKWKDYKFSIFVKAMVFNVFNHQQLYSWRTNYNQALTMANAGKDYPWVPDQGMSVLPAQFGKPSTASDYGSARSVNLSLGMRF